MLNTQVFYSHCTGTEYTIFRYVNCNIINAVYLLQCKSGKKYVGELFLKRMKGHPPDCECKLDLNLSQHLRSSGHTTIDLKQMP